MTPGDNQPTKSARTSSGDKTELYQIAYDHGLRTLDDQREELNGMRGRAGQYMAFIGSAMAFLVGTSLGGADRDGWFYVLAGLATALTAVAIGALCWVLNPKLVFTYRLSPRVLLDQWIDLEVPGPTEALLLKELARKFNEMIESNRNALSNVRRAYLALVLSGASGLLMWAVLAWVKG